MFHDSSDWPFHRRPLVWVVLVLLLAGVFCRSLYLDQKVYWVDEVFTSLRISGYREAEVRSAWEKQPLITAQDLNQFQFPSPEKTIVDTVGSLATHEPQLPPLYFVLTRWWVQGFGDSIAVTRSFSVLASLVALPLLFLLSQELFRSTPTSLMAVGLMAVSPFQVIYAQEARPYSLWTCLVLLASWTLLRALRRNTTLAWAGYALAAAAALYTFVYSAWVLLAQALYIALLRRNWRPGQGRRFAIAFTLAWLLFVPWLVAITQYWQAGLALASWQRQPPAAGFLGWITAWGLHLTRNFIDFDQNYTFGPSQLWPYLIVVLSAVGLVGYSLYYSVKTLPPTNGLFVLLLFTVPALGVILPDLLTGGQQSLATRYFVPTLVATTLAVAHLLGSQRHQPVGRIALAGIWALGLLSCANSAFAFTWWNKDGGYIPYITTAINHTEKPLVISDTDWWVFSLAHHLRPDIALEMFDSAESLPQIPRGYSHYFLYNAVEPARQALAAQGAQLTPFEQLENVPIQCLTPPTLQPGACPPPT